MKKSETEVFSDALRVTLEHEGVFSNHALDSGGKTKYGITEQTARGFGYLGDMKDLTKDMAAQIYRVNYWLRPNYHEVADRSALVAMELFDSGVNCGTQRASTWLQVALNGLNQNGKLYSDIKEDGAIGPGTLLALDTFLKHRGDEGKYILWIYLNGLQFQHYHTLIRNNPGQEVFMYGWLKRVFDRQARESESKQADIAVDVVTTVVSALVPGLVGKVIPIIVDKLTQQIGTAK